MDKEIIAILNEHNLPLDKWNHIQAQLWLQLVRDGLVKPNDSQAFYALGKYFSDYNKKTGKILPYARLQAYVQGYLSETTLQEDISQTPTFTSWFGKSKVKDKYGKPRRVYHGTFADIKNFVLDKTHADNFFGQGFYFTSSIPDVNHNYSHLNAPDINARIGNAISRLEDDMGEQEINKIIADYAKRMNKEYTSDYKLRYAALDDYMVHNPQTMEPYGLTIQSQGAIMPVYLKMEKPCYIGFGNRDTYFDYNSNYDEENEEDTPTGLGVDLLDNLSWVISGYGGDENEDLGVVWDLMYGGGAYAYEIVQKMRENNPLLNLACENDTCASALFADAIKQMGFDGIIMNAVKLLPNMKKSKRAMHYIVWNNNQIQPAFTKLKHSIEEETKLEEYCLLSINMGNGRINIMKDPTPEEMILVWGASERSGIKFIADSEKKEIIIFRGDIIAHRTVAKELELPYGPNDRYFYGTSECCPQAGKLVEIKNYGYDDSTYFFDRYPEYAESYIALCNKDWSWIYEYVDEVSFTEQKIWMLHDIEKRKRNNFKPL
jgi:hypothetical protein